MGSELVVHQNSVAEVFQIGKVFSESGYFADARQASQAIVKIMAGRELGFGPFASMANIHLIEGKPAIGAHLMAAAIRQSKRYDYRVVRLDSEACELAFFERHTDGMKELGRSTFTAKEAAEKGITQGKNGVKTNWKRFPANMLFARAISNGYRWFCPDAMSGVLAYTPDELDAAENLGNGEVIDVEAKNENAGQEIEGQPDSDEEVANGYATRMVHAYAMFELDQIGDEIKLNAAGLSEKLKGQLREAFALSRARIAAASNKNSGKSSPPPAPPALPLGPANTDLWEERQMLIDRHGHLVQDAETACGVPDPARATASELQRVLEEVERMVREREAMVHVGGIPF